MFSCLRASFADRIEIRQTAYAFTQIQRKQKIVKTRIKNT